jgi:hypothetical protein
MIDDDSVLEDIETVTQLNTFFMLNISRFSMPYGCVG